MPRPPTIGANSWTPVQAGKTPTRKSVFIIPIVGFEIHESDARFVGEWSPLLDTNNLTTLYVPRVRDPREAKSTIEIW